MKVSTCPVQMVHTHSTAEISTLPPNMRDYHFTGPIRPVYPLSPKRLIPPHIERPDYADDRGLIMFLESSSNVYGVSQRHVSL